MGALPSTSVELDQPTRDTVAREAQAQLGSAEYACPTFDTLPSDILHKICAHQSLVALCSLGATSQQLSRVLASEEFDDLFRSLLRAQMIHLLPKLNRASRESMQDQLDALGQVVGTSQTTARLGGRKACALLR